MVKKIITRICGGLGNQMFTYSVGERLARQYHVKQEFDLIEYFSSKYIFYKGLSTRQYQLNCFAGPRQYRTWPLGKSLALYFISAVDLVVKHDFLRKTLSLLGIHLYKSSNQFFPDADEDAHGKSIIYSTWLSFSTDKMPDRATLRKAFTLADPLSANSRSYLSQISASRSVSIHVRRTDYLVQPTSWALPIEYYKKAVATIRARVNDPQWIVFSDDPTWCKEQFSELEGAIFVTGNDACPWEDMELMKSCQHHILANSTFSWWSAYLSYNEKGLVYYPTNWGGGAPKNLPSTFIPKGWLGIA